MSLLLETEDVPATRNEAYEARRYGRILYSEDLLKNSPEAIAKIYSKIIPVAVQFDYARRLFEVTALCSEFDSVELSHMIPFYSVAVRVQRRKGSGLAYYVYFEKVELE